MKQPDSNSSGDAFKRPRAPGPPPQPPPALRRSSSNGSSPSKNSAAASFHQSAPTINSGLDVLDRMANNNSFKGDEKNNLLVSHGSNLAPITDVNELADRLINFKKTLVSTTAGNNGRVGKPTTNMRGRPRPPPPPPPPRPSSLGQPRIGEMLSPTKHLELLLRRRKSENSWSDATEDEYVRRMARIKLDQSDHNVQGNASSDLSSVFQNREMTLPSKMPPPPPFPAKKHETNFNECSMSVNSNKFNSSSNSVNSNKSSFVARPVKVSQFEDNNGPSTPTSKPKATMTTPQSLATKNIATPSDTSSAPQSSTHNCDKRGRCKFHPQYKLYKKKLLGGYEFIGNCPVCVAKSYYEPNLRGRNRTRAGDYDTASGKSPSAKVSGRTSRSRERGRSKSADRIPNVPNLDEDECNNYYETGSARMRTRPKSVEQRRSRSLERLRRSLSRESDRDLRISKSVTSHGKKVINALENIRDELLTTLTSPINSMHERNSRQGRSRSRERPRSREERQLSDNERSTVLMKGWSPSTKNLEKGLRALQQRESGSSGDKQRDETLNQKKKKNVSNQFVRQTDDVNFDKKTGRCKKHPSIILAKKSAFRSGSWEIIKKNGCPFCSEEAKIDSNRDEVGLDEDTKKKMEMLLKGSGEDSSSSTSPFNQDIVDSVPPEGVRGRKVSKLLYTTPMGETGWYTGEVDSEGKPHGHGRMRFKTGHSYEGAWNHGFSEDHMDNLERMKSGFGSHKAAWKQSKAAGAGASTLMPSSGSMYQYQQKSPHRGYSPAQVQQAQLQQAAMVSHEAWANMSPQERQMAMTQWYSGMSPVQGYPPII
ncbi:hypothetical protein ACHAXM_007815 [Skeletonema potamos]